MRTLIHASVTAALAAAAAATIIAAAPYAQLASTQSPATPSGPVQVQVSLSARRLVVLDGADTALTYTVAIGIDPKPTPTGSFSIRRIVWNPAWIPPDSKWAAGKKPEPPGAQLNPMKVVKIFFQEPDYYIHGTDELGSLGAAESHGCLRMDPDDAYRLAKYLMDHGGDPRSESWFWRVLHFRSDTQTVYLDHPVPMTIAP